MKKTTKIAALVISVITLMCLWIIPANAAIIPSKPTGLEAEPWPDNVDLYWNEASFADGYRVFIYKGGKWVKLADVEDDTYYCVEDLIASTNYRFAVRSYRKEAGSYTWSTSFATVNVKTEKIEDEISLKAVPGTTSVQLSWTKAFGASGYRVFRYENKKWVKVTDVSNKNRSYTVTGLNGLTNYYFSVRPYAKSSAGVEWAALSNVVKVATKDPLQVQLSASSDEKSVTLSWDKVPGATGYRVFIRQNGAWKALKTLGTTSYTVSSLVSDTTYYFCARAYQKANGVTKWLPLSTSFVYATAPAAKDLKAYRIEKLDKILSGNYLLEVTEYDEEYGDSTVVMAVRNKYVYYDVVNAAIRFIYNPKTNKDYIILDSHKAYTSAQAEPYESESVGDTDFPIEELRGNTTVSIAELDGRKVVCESYKDQRDIIYRFYFAGGTFIAYDLEYCDYYEEEPSEDTYERYYVTKFTTSVPTSYFAIPAGYTRITAEEFWELEW